MNTTLVLKGAVHSKYKKELFFHLPLVQSVLPDCLCDLMRPPVLFTSSSTTADLSAHNYELEADRQFAGVQQQKAVPIEFFHI